MSRFSHLPLVLVLAAAPAHAASILRTVATAPVPGRLLVVDDVDALRIGPTQVPSTRDPRLAATLARLGLARARSLGRAGHGVHFLVLESTRADFDPARAAAELRATGRVRAAVPNLRMRLHVMPNDPDLPSEWYVDDGGFADVRLAAAWDVEKGDATTRIGVMDTGVDPIHPDLAGKIWTNPGEIPGNSIDDDGNGWTDDVHGWDFGDADADAQPHPVLDPSLFDLDIGFHGTFVAALAAAAPNNAEGIAGAGWNCSIVPLKVVDSAGDITLEAMTEAFAYATAMHLEVLNMSLGTAEQPGVADYFQALVDDATAAGVLCVASAGNDGTSAHTYPAACAGVLSVAATDDQNARASFSNFGPWVRIAGPGATMWSAIPTNYAIDDFSLLFYEIFFGWDGLRPYMGGDGTSFSAPVVAGVAALVRSRHPEWPPLTVADHLVATGDAVAYDESIGPRLNAFRAVTEAALTVEPAPLLAGGFQVAPNPSFAEATFRFDLPAGGAAHVRILDCSGRIVRDLASSGLAPGANTLRWDGADDGGRATPPGLYVFELQTTAGRRTGKLLRVR